MPYNLDEKERKPEAYQSPKTNAGTTHEHRRLKRDAKRKKRILEIFEQAKDLLKHGTGVGYLSEYLEFTVTTTEKYIEAWEDMDLIFFKNKCWRLK